MSRSDGFSSARLARMSEIMHGHVGRGAVAGVVTLVCRHGEVHVEAIGVQDLATGAPMRRDTIFRIASMTKPITAAAAMMLVEEGKVRLDDPVDRWLPELADPTVLRAIDSPLDDTVPAQRPITLRDLLTLRPGFGMVVAAPGATAIQRAMEAAGLAPGPDPVSHAPDEYMRRLGGLPLAHQPGEQWMYHTGFDVLCVLLARVAGMGLEAFLRDRIFTPLGMKDTAFSVNEEKLGRLATCYRTDAATGRLAVYDEARGGLWSQPPAFPSELVSTADDYLAFGRMMLNLGQHGAARVLARPTVEVMTTDQISPEQKAASPFFPGFWDSSGWGFGVSMMTRRNGIAGSPGCYGWMGGFGTAWCSDPHEDLVAILLTQRLMGGPNDTDINDDFLTLAYAAIDD